MFQAPLCPSSGAREYYTVGCCLWYLVLWYSSCRYGVELRVVCPVCGQQPANRTMHSQNHLKFIFVCWLSVSNCSFWGLQTSTDQYSTCASLVKSSYYFSERLFSYLFYPFLAFLRTFRCARCNVHRLPAVPVCPSVQK